MGRGLFSLLADRPTDRPLMATTRHSPLGAMSMAVIMDAMSSVCSYAPRIKGRGEGHTHAPCTPPRPNLVVRLHEGGAGAEFEQLEGEVVVGDDEALGGQHGVGRKGDKGRARRHVQRHRRAERPQVKELDVGVRAGVPAVQAKAGRGDARVAHGEVREAARVRQHRRAHVERARVQHKELPPPHRETRGEDLKFSPGRA